jgi:hypothetical protein
MSKDTAQQKSKDQAVSQYTKCQPTSPRIVNTNPDSGKEILEVLKYVEASGVRLRGTLTTEPEQAQL